MHDGYPGVVGRQEVLVVEPLHLSLGDGHEAALQLRRRPHLRNNLRGCVKSILHIATKRFTSALLVCGRCANVGGMPSTMSAREDSRDRLLLLIDWWGQKTADVMGMQGINHLCTGCPRLPHVCLFWHNYYWSNQHHRWNVPNQLQGDPSRCSEGCVDIKTKVLF